MNRSRTNICQSTIAASTLSLAIIFSCCQLPCHAGQESISGYLIDQNCARALKDDSGALNFVRHHTRNCALLPSCRAKGYALFSDGKWFDLDLDGSKLAERIIRASKRERGFHVSVKGEVKGKIIKVERIIELKEDDGSSD